MLLSTLKSAPYRHAESVCGRHALGPMQPTNIIQCLAASQTSLLPQDQDETPKSSLDLESECHYACMSPQRTCLIASCKRQLRTDATPDVNSSQERTRLLLPSGLQLPDCAAPEMPTARPQRASALAALGYAGDSGVCGVLSTGSSR